MYPRVIVYRVRWNQDPPWIVYFTTLIFYHKEDWEKNGPVENVIWQNFLQALKSMEDFFERLGNMTDEIGSSENTRDSLLVDLQYIFIMAVCITGVPD